MDCRCSIPFGFVLMGALLCFAPCAWSQKDSQAELEAERNAITERIAATRALLDASRDDQEKTTQALAIMREELVLRQQLLGNLGRERKSAESRLDDRKETVRRADAQLQALKDEYAGMIRLAAQLEHPDAFWGLVLDADGAVQVFRRLLLIEEYGRARKEQAELISTSTEKLRGELDSLRRERASLMGIEQELRSQRDASRQGARKQESLLAELRSRERELKDQLAREEARRAELGKAIDRIIAAARRSAGTGAEFAATPEGRIIGAEFKANRGKLPWPVSEGVIVGRFGTHSHPTIPGIKIERRGVDIATSAQAEVAVVFSGRVSHVLSIPGGGMAVMVDHGSHRTVYANLAQVEVADGQDVMTGQRIGQVLDLGSGHRAHFEIWDASGSAPLDPELWIAR